MKALSFILMFFFLNIGALSFAEEIPCLMRLEKEKVSPGKQVLLEIELPDTFGATAPELPVINDIDILFAGSSAKAAQEKEPAVKGRIFLYKVLPRIPGVFSIGPFLFQRGTYTYRTNQLTLIVEKEETRRSPAQKPQLTDLRDHIYVVMEIPKTTIFINEKAPAFLKLYTDWIDLENISFSQKQSEYLITKDFKDKAVDVIDKGAARFAVLKYSSSFYAVTAGTYTLEPVSVKFNIALPQKSADGKIPKLINDNMPFYESFIGAAYSRPAELVSKPVEITVLSLPAEEKPKSFRGAVGKFTFELKADRKAIKPGEALRLTAIIAGEGNYDALSAPVLDDTIGLKIAEPKAARRADSITYDMSLTVQSKEIASLPNLVFSYFDPAEKRYVTLSRPIPVKIEKGATPESRGPEGITEAKKAREAVILPLKTTAGRFYRSASAPYKKAGFWIFLILPVLMIPCAVIFDRRRSYLKGHPHYAALIKAARMSEKSIQRAARYLREGNGDAFYREVFKTMQEYVGERALISPAGVTGQTVDDYIARYVGQEMAARIKQIFSECYSARYAVAGKDHHAMSLMLREVKDVIALLNGKEFGGK